jgi:diaminopimelate epimerase
MEFAKWEALGNDYVIVDRTTSDFLPTPANVGLICDRHRGIGADGMLLLDEPPSGASVASLKIFNPDGSEAELSGNGARQAFLYLHREGRAPGSRFSLATAAGEVRAEILADDRARVDMGRATLSSNQYPGGEPDGKGTLAAGGELWAFQHVSIGNPQCAIRIAEAGALEGLDLTAAGPEIEHAAIFPGRTNVSWWTETAPGRIRARIFERGVGETTASGTGACGAAVDYVLRGAEAEVTVEMEGGELEVKVDEDLHVDLAGEAHELFRGRVGADLAARLES